jgi:hypothetical protein
MIAAMLCASLPYSGLEAVDGENRGPPQHLNSAGCCGLREAAPVAYCPESVTMVNTIASIGLAALLALAPLEAIAQTIGRPRASGGAKRARKHGSEQGFARTSEQGALLG